MQRFPCPFCGLRPETEFSFVGEAGKTRPETTRPIEADAWASYLFDQRNAKGATREVWLHLPCAEMFLMERDSVTMAVLGATAFRKEPA